MRCGLLILPFTLWLSACSAFLEPELAQLANEPVTAESRVRGLEPWAFGRASGTAIATQHFQIFTTTTDPIFQHQAIRILEALHDRHSALIPFKADHKLECYIFSSRSQWEHYTRDRGGESAPIYLQISSGGYCQQGVLAGYDIGRDHTLSVIAHEAWHQFSWFAFKDRLPSWLEEGLATQNEAITWDQGQPTFLPERNSARRAALARAVRNGTLFKLEDLLSTHAGRVIKMPQASIDAYYAQLWSFTLFFKSSPLYGPRLDRLLGDAAGGRLTLALAETSVTPEEIRAFSEHWNAVAGPVYLETYISRDLDAVEHEYRVWLTQFLRNH